MGVSVVILVTALQASPNDFVDRWISDLASPSAEVRDEASRALLELGTDAKVALHAAADGPHPDVAIRARHLFRVIALSARFSPALIRTVPEVVEKLLEGERSRWTEVFLEVTDHHGRVDVYPELGPEDVAPLSERAILYAKSRDDRTTAMHRAARWKCATAVPTIRRFLRDSDRVVRTAAIESLMGLGAEDCLPDFVRGLTDNNPGVRYLAVIGMKKFGGISAAPRIRRMLEDRDMFVRKIAITSLASVGDRESIPAIAKAMRDPDRDVARAAMDAIEQLRGIEAVPEILTIFTDRVKGDRLVLGADRRFEALELLEALDAREAVPFILKIQADNDPALRVPLERTLSALTRGSR